MKVFIAGPRAVSRLNTEVINRLENIYNKNFMVLVGDANGIDKAIQQYYHEKGYNNVMVYASGERTRNNIGSWKTTNVNVAGDIKGFNFYALKDKQMAKDADYGLMIWNGKSKGTFNNIVNLIKYKKIVLLYLIPTRQFYKIENIKDIDKLVRTINNNEVNRFYLDVTRDIEQLKLEM